jgi:peptide/nickel transport system substrate-binding protein
VLKQLILLTLSLVLITAVACGDDEEESTAAPAAPTAKVVAAATTAPAAVSTEPTTLTIGTKMDPVPLDPHQIQSGDGGGFLSDFVHNRLLQHDDTMTKPFADLASSWTRSSDGKTIVFTLRDDVVFHTGRSFSGDDVVWNWDRIINDIGARGRGKNVLSEVTSYTVSGNELTITLTGDSPVILPNMALWGLAIIDSESMDGIDTSPVGTGPFTFVEFIPGDRTVLEKFVDHYDTAKLAIRPDRILMTPIEETTTRLAALKAGQIDIAVGLPIPNVEEIRNTAGLQVLEQALSAAYLTMAFNVHAGATFFDPIPKRGDANFHPIADPKVRQAIQYAVDKDAINKVALLGMGDTDCNFIPKALEWAYEPLDCPTRDLDKARALLAEADHGDDWTLTIAPVAGEDIDESIALIIQQNLAEVGITVIVEPLEINAWIKDLWKGGLFEATIAGYAREPDPDGLMQSVFRGESPVGPWGGNNVMGYYDEEIEKLFDDGKAISDPALRKAIYTKIVKKVVFEDVPLIRFTTKPVFWAANDRIQDAYIMPQGYMSFTNWTFKP